MGTVTFDFKGHLLIYNRVKDINNQLSVLSIEPVNVCKPSSKRWMTSFMPPDETI